MDLSSFDDYDDLRVLCLALRYDVIELPRATTNQLTWILAQQSKVLYIPVQKSNCLLFTLGRTNYYHASWKTEKILFPFAVARFGWIGAKWSYWSRFRNKIEEEIFNEEI